MKNITKSCSLFNNLIIEYIIYAFLKRGLRNQGDGYDRNKED